MKFVLEEGDERFINNINRSIEEGELPPLFVSRTDTRYYIEFECTDIAKANAFVYTLMNNDKSLKEDIGIDVKCIAYSHPDRKISKLKKLLQNVIEQLDRLD